MRTPDSCFTVLPDFAYAPRYADVGQWRMAWVEAGPADGPPVLLLHGEPTWSFLYRSMIPVLAEAGLRVIAPDLIGFGRSDKPSEQSAHSYAAHVEWVRALAFDVLGLDGVTVFGQDWGGLIGLRLAAESLDRVARIVASNTGLPTGDHPMPEIWWQFRAAIQSAPTLDVGRFVASGCVRGLSDQARAAYSAPFPSDEFTAGPRAMPGLVPTAPDDPASAANRAAWTVLSTSTVPVLVAFGDSDPITGPMRPILERVLPGAVAHPLIERAGHFIQEDAGPELAAAMVAFIRST